MMVLRIVIILALVAQLAAIIYALRLVKQTRYNVIWILYIVGLTLLAVLLILLFIAVDMTVPREIFVWLTVIGSVCLSFSAVYAHKLVGYIDRLDLQKQLYNKRVLTAVLRAEEKSRSEFSKELHDGLGPLLSSAKMALSALTPSTGMFDRDEILKNAAYVIDEAIRSLREISNNLSPHVLNDFGLARGIQNFISHSVSMHDAKRIRFTTNLRSERFDPDLEVIFYRVACELIHNSLKHSDCTEIRLSLTLDDALMTLRYADNGRGFDPAQETRGMGLANIQSRINSLNGTVEITSAPGHGMSAVISAAAHVPAQNSRFKIQN